MPSDAIDSSARWWREAIIYQIWPKSFYSGRGTETGDIPGIISKLDYIKSLGANTIWLSPHYTSPMKDEGYDVADYENVNPMFGTLADAERLIKECHARDMKIIFDLVINHTSDQHNWFKESRSSKDNPKADWYIWRPAKYDKDGNRKPPNNWASCFSESAWSWDDTREEYYLHLFCVEQPDLNWTNEECRKTIYQSSMKFWLDRGLNGFRVDTVNLYSKPMDFPDAPITDPNSDIQPAGMLYANGPEMHKYMKEMGAILNRYDAMTVGELPLTPDPKMVLDYVGLSKKELSMVFTFDVVDIGRKQSDMFSLAPYALTDIKGFVAKWGKFLYHTDGWTTSFLSNHDQGRPISRFANDLPAFRSQSSKMLSLLVLTQSGTPFVYQGEELGMTNVPIEWDENEYKDVNTINYMAKLRAAGISEEKIKTQIWPSVNRLARDNARTPVQWNAEEYAGFSTTKPWMRVNDNYKEINAKQQLSDPNSIFHFWQKGIALRKDHLDIFTYGDFDLHDEKNENVFAYVKTAKSGQQALVTLNFSTDPQPFTLPKALELKNVTQTLCTRDIKNDKEDLQAYEGRVLIF